MAKSTKRRTGKRHGETYAQQLAREKAEKQAFGYEVGMEVSKRVKDEVANDLMKIFVIAANRAWGIGNGRLRRFTEEVYNVSVEFDNYAKSANDDDDEDFEYARDKLNERIQQIFGDEPVEFRLRY